MDRRDPYTPVACVLHERLEFAVLRRLPLLLRWADDTGAHVARVEPLDVTTRDGAEWLTLRLPEGEVLELRLDRIEAVTEMPGLARGA